MRKLTLAVGSSLILAAPLAQADIVGLGASVGYWDTDVSGKVATGSDSVDVNDELRLKDDGKANASIYLEHPVPLLPNVRLAYTLIQQSGNGTLTSDYGNVSVGNVRSELDLEQLDLTLYYEILDNWVNLDLGLTVRDFSGELLVTQSGSTPEQTKADAVLPLGYIAARFDLPLTGVAVGAEGNFIAYDGDSIRDFNVYGQFSISLLQLRAGYRQIAVDYEDGSDLFDVKIDGPFISAGVTF
ncbi:TIGR04219 family outer membrane beta-barrel protein [Marinobacter salexigens]|uniref:TIGR04219 family outer membrane beta-barrel protein n=1 Tax=Marinobacter salexigens TaxID=1925763 RepID=UPI000C28CF35|nr:TIGR04219 family outer membrane beta-barrel protein [Marinobacter salexigens]